MSEHSLTNRFSTCANARLRDKRRARHSLLQEEPVGDERPQQGHHLAPHLLLVALQAMDLRWPEADFDIETEKQRLADEDPVS